MSPPLDPLPRLLAGPWTRDDLARALAGLPTDALDLAARLADLPRHPAWSSVPLGEGPGWSLGLFLMPAPAEIPLHDHPDMHVFTRVVAGRLRLTAWDWVERGVGLARRVADDVLDPAAPVAVTAPTGRNLHRLQALDDVAFLDLFVPDYGPDRPCTYYARAGAVVVAGERLERLVTE